MRSVGQQIRVGSCAWRLIRWPRAHRGEGSGWRWAQRTSLAALLIFQTFLSGCFSPPRRVAELDGRSPAGAVFSEQGNPAGKAEAQEPFWSIDGDLDPARVLVPGRRVVVTEFNVEFVDYQFQLPIPRQPMFKNPMITMNPVHMAISLIGFGRRYTPIDEQHQRSLASALYNAFLQDLRRRGLGLVTRDELQASSGYAALRKSSAVGSSLLVYLNIFGSDTGIVMHTRTMAAPGLCVLQGSSRGAMALPGFLDNRASGPCVLRGSVRARTAAEAQILRETHADVALAVRLRVGTFQGHPALEHRSMIRLTTCDGSTTLRACHSLVSDLMVTSDSRYRPVVGRIQPVDAGMFSEELAGTVPTFVGLALSESKP